MNTRRPLYDVLGDYIDTIRALRSWLAAAGAAYDILDKTKDDPPPIPEAYRVIIQSIGALAYLTEDRVATLYAALKQPYGDSPAGLLEFKKALGMTRAQIDSHYYGEEPPHAGD
jgi:hypothetical protein